MSNLMASKDRKVANSVTPNGKQARFSNTFGLANGKQFSCVGATPYCEKICYAGKLENLFKAVGTAMLSNFEILSNATYDQMVDMIDKMIIDFEAASDKHNAPKFYRIHWDGDFFSSAYVKAWIAVINRHHNTRFWVYTRNEYAAIALKENHKWDNLSVYFSADEDNESTAKYLWDNYSIRPAAVAETFADSQAMVKRITGKVGAKCPEQTNQYPLVSAEGSACARCGLCIFEKANISFSRSKK